MEMGIEGRLSEDEGTGNTGGTHYKLLQIIDVILTNRWIRVLRKLPRGSFNSHLTIPIKYMSTDTIVASVYNYASRKIIFDFSL